MSHKHHRNVRWTTRTVYFYSAQKQLRFAALWSSFAPPFSEGHDAQVMSVLFGFTSFTGSLEITSTEPIVSLSLNFEATPVFSSLPPGELDAAAQ